ncbi:MAG: SMP-30/gluconolactonase/LRE family protein, partial [Pseudomonadota bacterium]
GMQLEEDAGAIYRYYRGEVRTLYAPITIPNAICFAPDRSCAYWTDTARAQIMRQALDPADGWPEGEPQVLIDVRDEGLKADGAVVDAEGNIWNAQWGSARVAVYSPEGEFLRAVPVPGLQASCPAFGGPDLTTLYVTTAGEGLTGDAEGRTYAVPNAGRGLPEYQVIL